MSALSPVASPSRYQYRCTASHHKTLSVLGKVKNFAKLSVEELSGYCGLMKSENGCQSSAHAADALASRFGWATVSRLADIETAWKSLNFSSDDAEVDQEEYGGEELKTSSDATKVVKEDKLIPPDKLSEPTISASRIPIVIRNNSWERKILLCEVDDQEFNISGDSGAVGRISVDPTSIMVDVKGRQYKGQIRPGPTVMLLNLAPPVGQTLSGGTPYQQTARVEVLTNEFCQLIFERDLLGSMMGLYTGSMSSYDDNQDEIEGEESQKQNKKRSIDDDSDDNNDVIDGAAAKAKAPKISTITNRTRTVKKGSKKKSTTKTQKAKK